MALISPWNLQNRVENSWKTCMPEEPWRCLGPTLLSPIFPTSSWWLKFGRMPSWDVWCGRVKSWTRAPEQRRDVGSRRRWWRFRWGGQSTLVSEKHVLFWSLERSMLIVLNQSWLQWSLQLGLETIEGNVAFTSGTFWLVLPFYTHTRLACMFKPKCSFFSSLRQYIKDVVKFCEKKGMRLWSRVLA